MYYLQFLQIRNPSTAWPSMVLCLESHKDEIKVSDRLCFCLATLGKNLFPDLLKMMAKFSSKQLQDKGPHFFPVRQVRNISVSFQRPLTFPGSWSSFKSRNSRPSPFHVSEPNPSDLSFCPLFCLLLLCLFFVFKGLCVAELGPLKSKQSHHFKIISNFNYICKIPSKYYTD